jgi:hypothetical protein
MLQKIATALNQRVKMSLVSWNLAIAPQLKKRSPLTDKDKKRSILII